MSHLLNVMVQSGTHYLPSDNSWVDFFISTLAALIGTGTALWIFYLQTRHDKQKRNEELDRMNNQRLHYFSININNVIKTANIQLSYFEEYAKALKENPYKLPYLSILAGNTLKRLTEDLNYEELFHPFIQKFGHTKSTTQTFSQTNAILDFLYNQNVQLQSILPKAFDADHERRQAFQEIVERRMDDVAEMGIFAVRDGGKDEFGVVLNEIIVKFYEKEFDHSDICYIHQEFVLPVKSACIKQNGSNSEALKIARDLKKATHSFSSIETQNINLAETIYRIHTRYKEEVERLEKLTAELRIAFKEIS